MPFYGLLLLLAMGMRGGWCCDDHPHPPKGNQHSYSWLSPHEIEESPPVARLVGSQEYYACVKEMVTDLKPYMDISNRSENMWWWGYVEGLCAGLEAQAGRPLPLIDRIPEPSAAEGKP